MGRQTLISALVLPLPSSVSSNKLLNNTVYLPGLVRGVGVNLIESTLRQQSSQGVGCSVRGYCNQQTLAAKRGNKWGTNALNSPMCSGPKA